MSVSDQVPPPAYGDAGLPVVPLRLNWVELMRVTVKLPLAAVLPVTPAIVTRVPVVKPCGPAVVMRMGPADELLAPVMAGKGSGANPVIVSASTYRSWRPTFAPGSA